MRFLWFTTSQYDVIIMRSCFMIVTERYLNYNIVFGTYKLVVHTIKRAFWNQISLQFVLNWFSVSLLPYNVLTRIVAWVFMSFQWFFIPATKWDKHLLVEGSFAVYNLWCQQWFLMASDDTQSTILNINVVIVYFTTATKWDLAFIQD